jgi:6-phosphogluconolactonase
VHIFWRDERYVPPDDPQSNYRMAKETLLDHVPCPTGNVHPMPTHYPDPDVAARHYERILRSYFSAEWPRFDLILLGLGEEGPYCIAVSRVTGPQGTKPLGIAGKAPAEPSVRLTLTLPVLTHAANIYFLLTGVKKAEALHNVLAGTADPQTYPAAGVRVLNGNLVWWVDRKAAALVTHQQLNDSSSA